MDQSDRPFIIDVEASGFGAESYPIEVGIALARGDRYSSLIQPPNHWKYWDESAEAIHQITPEILESHGTPAKNVASQLNQILKDATVYTDAWVVDKPWLNQLFEEAGLEMTFIVSSLELILSEQQIEIWDDTKLEVIEELDMTRHRASVDAFIVQETFRRTRFKLFEANLLARTA